ncbi:potassium channel family protein [Natronolimnohabitans innermongolicus]|uniref:Ion channel pore / trkA domain-containing protein n=1 Tax=Natronolimnohabitans innermongolicus JCM 12255 TaxID=1227499 RepID=L9XHK5_9EURY|nr:potassium channel protein [Natronolimnohabitans innermongolicus]ELY61224.1 ion channel pore / trkA domain-containing protein [Natronolimnohabitans innermongolicus JCM 12255]
MVALTRRLAIYVASLLLLIGLYSLVYRWGMAAFEGESRTWYQSLEFVVQSMTTTGYGQDAPWETLEMTALVVLIQVTGIAYIAVAIPQFVVPWLETLVQPTPPTEIDHVEDHVIVVGYTDLCDTLVDELEAGGTASVIVESDDERAQTLHENGFTVLHGDPGTDETLEAARLEDATAVVVDATERDLFRTVLAIESRDPTATVVPLVFDPAAARYFRYAGVDEVLSPRHRLGKALGDRVRNVVSPDFTGLELGEELDVAEFHVDPDTDLFGEPLAATRGLEDAGSGGTILGAWVRGDFVTTLSHPATIDENTSLLVAGTDDDLEAVTDATGTAGTRYQTTGDPVVVLGAGLVGQTAAGTLERAGLESTVVDREDGENVDVVGDATEETTLLEAGVDAAETCLVALDGDTDAILATLTANALNPELELIAGAGATSSVDALRTAGADYVLALPNVAGRMVTRRVFEQEVMTFEEQLRLLETDATGLEGETLSLETIRDETGCIVVAVERDDDVHTAVDGERFTADDQLVVAGTDAQIGRFRDTYGDRSDRGKGNDNEASADTGVDRDDEPDDG